MAQGQDGHDDVRLTELLQQIPPCVENARHPGESQHPRLCPLFLRRVAGMVDEDVPAARLNLLLVGCGGRPSHAIKQVEQYLEVKC